MVSPLSLRLPDELAAKVRRLATLEQRSLAEMVRLLTDEAVRMREFPDMDEAQLRTALRYYDAYPGEIDARVALNQRA